MPNAYDASGASNPSGPKVLASVPESRVSAAEITQPYQALARAVGHFGDFIDEATVDFHRQAAEQDAERAMVARGPDGKVSLELRPLELTKGDAAYNSIIRQRSLAVGQTQVDRQRTNLALKYQHDPEGFANEARNFVRGLFTSGPREYRGMLGTYAERVLGQTENHLRAEKTKRDIAEGKEGLLLRVGQQVNELTQLARQGGTETEEFGLGIKNLTDLYGALSGTPAYGVSKAKADDDLARIGEMMKVEALTGRADKLYDEHGGKGAIEFYKKTVIDVTGSRLSDADRTRGLAAFQARIQYREGQRKEEIAVNRKSLDALNTAVEKGRAPADGLWDGPIATADRLGDVEGATKARWRRMLFGQGGSLSTLQQLFPEGARRFLRGEPAASPAGPTDGNSSPPGAATPATFAPGAPPPQRDASWADSIRWAAGQVGASPHDLAAVIHFESKFSTSIRGGAGNRHIGSIQFGADEQRRYGANQSQTPAEQMVAVVAYLKDRGFKPGMSLLDLYSTVNAGRPGLYNASDTANGGTPGSVRDKVEKQFAEAKIAAAALLGGSYEPPAGVSGFGGGPAGRPAGVAGPGAPNAYTLPSALAAQSISEDQKVKFTESLADSVLSGLKHGQLPSPDIGALIAQVAEQYPDKLGKKATEIAAQLAGSQISDGTATGQQRLEQMRRMAQESPDLFGQQAVRAADEWAIRREKRFKDDAISAGAETSPPWYSPVPPIDWSSPSRIAQGVADHGAAAVSVSAHRGIEAQSAFTGQTLTVAKEKLIGGSLDQRIALLAGISDLPPAIMKATLAAMANDEEGRVFAIAGSVARYAPDVAKDILVGRAELQAEKRLGPKDDQTLADAIGKRLPLTDFPAEAREAVKSAALALYARSSSKANDTSQTLNETRLDNAIMGVTGGVLESGGAKVLAPYYGARQEDLDGLVRGLTDADFSGARLTDGSTFPASALKPGRWTSAAWRLKSFGEGRFLVVSGPADSPRPLMREATDTSGAAPGVFVLDLAAKRDRIAAPLITVPQRAPSLTPSWPAPPVDFDPSAVADAEITRMMRGGR